MSSFKRPCAFDPLDLEIIDRVYEAVWAQIEAREIDRDNERDPERQQTLREQVFAIAGMGPVDFDVLYEHVMDTLRQSVGVERLPISADARRPSID